MEWVNSVLFAIFTAVVASIVFVISTRLVRPKIKISDQITVSPTVKGNEEIRFKIINMRHRRVLDVRVEIFFEYSAGSSPNDVKKQILIGDKMIYSVIPRKKFNDQTCDNAIRIRIPHTQLIDAMARHADGNLRVEVFSQDTWSAVNGFKDRDYKHGLSDFVFGEFKVGSHFQIQPSPGDQKWNFPEDIKAAQSKHLYDLGSVNPTVEFARVTILQSLLDSTGAAIAPTLSQARLTLAEARLHEEAPTKFSLADFQNQHGGIDSDPVLIKAKITIAAECLSNAINSPQPADAKAKLFVARATLQIAAEKTRLSLTKAKIDMETNAWGTPDLPQSDGKIT